jgi:hypothetical protein
VFCRYRRARCAPRCRLAHGDQALRRRCGRWSGTGRGRAPLTHPSGPSPSAAGFGDVQQPRHRSTVSVRLSVVKAAGLDRGRLTAGSQDGQQRLDQLRAGSPLRFAGAPVEGPTETANCKVPSQAPEPCLELVWSVRNLDGAKHSAVVELAADDHRALTVDQFVWRPEEDSVVAPMRSASSTKATRPVSCLRHRSISVSGSRTSLWSAWRSSGG